MWSSKPVPVGDHQFDVSDAAILRGGRAPVSQVGSSALYGASLRRPPRQLALTSTRASCIALLIGLGMVVTQASCTVFTGELRAAEAESIYVPPSDSSPVVLRYYVPEGEMVEPGDVLVRIDPGNSTTQVRSLTAQIAQTQARVAKEIAELQVREIDAEIALVDAEAARAKAEVDAAVPREFLSALDADRYAGELERATREFSLKQAELQVARDAVARRRGDASLELAKLQADLDYHTAQVATAEQRAERAGVVIHGFDPWRGQRFDEGASGNPGQKIGEVVADGGMEVRAYVLEPDRVSLVENDPLILSLDALPGMTFSGRIERIAGAPEPKAEWGDGRYFSVDISLDAGEHASLLRPGMSVRVATRTQETRP